MARPLALAREEQPIPICFSNGIPNWVRDAAVEVEKSTLAQVVYERLKEDIFDFRMAPGERYSGQELATRLGVSRTPLRFALHVLAREGFLQRIEGHTSWQVRPFELGYFEDLYDFRVQIDVVAVRRLMLAADGAGGCAGRGFSRPRVTLFRQALER